MILAKHWITGFKTYKGYERSGRGRNIQWCLQPSALLLPVFEEIELRGLCAAVLRALHVSAWLDSTAVFCVRGGGGGWHKALAVGSVGLWRRLLASRPRTFCYAKQASVLLRASALPRASPCLGGGGNPECNFGPWRPPLTA